MTRPHSAAFGRPFAFLFLAFALAFSALPASAVYVLVDTGDQGQQGDSDALNCLLSGNGRFVFFDSWADNLVPGITNARDNVFMRDLVTGAVTRVSVTPEGSQVVGPPDSPFFLGGASADGRYVAISSFCSLLNGGGGLMLCYVKDTQTGGVQALLSQYVSCFDVPLSGDGRYALFVAGGLVPGEAPEAGRPSCSTARPRLWIG